MKTFLKSLFFLIAIVTLNYYTNSGLINRPLGSSEKNFGTAISLPLDHHWLDSGSLPLSDVASKIMHQDKQSVRKLHQSMVDNDDIAALRNFHLPLAFTIYHLAESKFGIPPRVISLAYSSLILVATFFLSFQLSYGRSMTTALTASVITACTLFALQLTTAITPLLCFSLLAILTFCCLERWVSTKRAIWGYSMSTCLALGALSLELFPLVLLSVISFALFNPSAKRLISKYFLTYTAGVFLLLTILLWPAGIIKGKIVVSYLSYYGEIFPGAGELTNSSFLNLENHPLFCIGFLVLMLLNIFALANNTKLSPVIWSICVYVIMLSGLTMFKGVNEINILLSLLLPYTAMTTAGIALIPAGYFYHLRVSLSIILAIFFLGEGLSQYRPYFKLVNSEVQSIGFVKEKLSPESKLVVIGAPHYFSARSLGISELSNVPENLREVEELEVFIQAGKFSDLLIIEPSIGQRDFGGLKTIELSLKNLNFSRSSSIKTLSLYQR